MAEGGTGSEPRRAKIKSMLDNTILDWNRPSQLTTINAKRNYDALIPAIEKLLVEVGSGHDEQTEGRIRELETALRPFADAYERGVAGDYIWPADQSFYRQAYHALRGTRFKSSSVSGGE